MNKSIVSIVLLLFHIAPLQAASTVKNFVTIAGDRLFDGKEELRFISFTLPGLYYIEDNMPFSGENPWRLPNDYEIVDVFKSIRQMGIRVARVYPLTVRQAGEGPDRPVHVTGPGQFDESALKIMDKVLFYANEMGVRLVIPFVDSREINGSYHSYAAFRNKPADDFWTDPEIRNDFKATIKYIINRKNIYTGQYYRNDKAILAWETGNKLPAPAQWTSDIAAFIKSLDKKHLLIDGVNSAVIRDESLLDPNIDLVISWHTPEDGLHAVEQIRQNRARCWGKKACIVGNIASVDNNTVQQVMEVIISNGINGIFIGNLYGHNRDGGFYWHSEAHSNGLIACHWPGFAKAPNYDERKLLREIRRKAFEINNIPLPVQKVPDPPVLLPIEDVAAISWQGSAGATLYDIERACGLGGKWTTVAQNVNDAWVQNSSLFADKTAKTGVSYYYRVIAKNAAGRSLPSNQVKAGRIKHLTLVDEMQDSRYIYAENGVISFIANHARECKEDMHRLAAEKDASITYHLPRDIVSFRLYAFYPDTVTDLQLYVSDSGEEYIPLTSEKIVFKVMQHDCNYYIPILYESNRLPNYVKFLKIHFSSLTELARTEIKYGN